MAFSQVTINRVNAPVLRGSEVYVSWGSSNPAGGWYQVYINQRLAWYGQRSRVWLPIPSGPIRIDIGSVNGGEQLTDFSPMLALAPYRRCRLEWQAGRFLSQDIRGFKVYGSNDPGAAIDYTTSLANINAYPAGLYTDGFGLGTFGSGGLGSISGSYSWTSGPLSSGSWAFGIVPYDSYGNEGAVVATTVTIVAPPRAPAAHSDGRRLSYCLRGLNSLAFGVGGFGLSDAILTWNPSSS